MASLLLAGATELGVSLSDAQGELLTAYLRRLVGASSHSSLSSIASPREAVLKHGVDSLAPLLVPAIARADAIVDVGAGAGFPAVPLAIASPSTEVLALESRDRKCRFISDAARELGIDNLNVTCARSEDLARASGRDAYPAVVCRALASPAVAVELCLPLVRPGGILVVLCGAAAVRHVSALRHVAEQIGGGAVCGTTYFLPVLHHERGRLEISKTVSTPERFPRRAGMAKKRPLV